MGQDLSSAVRKGDLEKFKILYENKTIGDSSNLDRDEYQIFNDAFNYGHLNIIKYLVEKGYDNNYLFEASVANHSDIIKYLINIGADIHTASDAPLRWASKYGNLDLVQFLINNGADIHGDDDAALSQAIWYNHLEIVKLLIKKGANIHTNNDEVLFLAIKNGYIKLMEFLIENGANWRKFQYNPILIKFIKSETNKIKQTLTTNYLLLRKITPKIVIDNKIKTIIPKSLLLRIVYQSYYINIINKKNQDLKNNNNNIPIQLILLARIMKIKNIKNIYDINILKEKFNTKFQLFL